MEHVGKLAFKLIAGEASNFKNLEDEATNLTQKLELLETRRHDVLNELHVEESANRGKKRKREVEDWLNIVNEKIGESEKLIQDAQNCAILSRGDLSKQVVCKVREITELIDQSTCFQGLVLDTLELEKVPLVTTTSEARGHAFQRNLENICSFLMDDTVSSIGIHGMGGVGKTTLAMRVHDNLLREPEFGNRVYFVTASQECTVHKLQNDIAEAMNIKVSGKYDEKWWAEILHNAMKKKQKFVLILDDLWEAFDKEKIGIPSKGHKLLVTSRTEQICNVMDCEKVIKVDVLTEKEAWELFKEKNGNVELTPDVTEIAKKVAKRCGGLPLGIITMARSMRGVTDESTWMNAFVELKESLKGLTEIEREVFPILLCSYNRLENPTLQNCFLYCSLYPEDHEIQRDELVRKFILEELLDKRISRQEEIDQGNAILNKLENVGLLLVGISRSSRRHVKMHDLARDMALRITRENPRFMVKSGLQLQEIPSEDEWTQDLNKVSLMYNNISTIPDGMSPRCSSLTSLNLSYNGSLFSIPDSLFEHMQSLQTLDLSGTRIKMLPDSLSLLVNLKGLLLGSCRELVSLPSLENLKALRELDLTNTNSFRGEIGGLESLTNLKCLTLEGSSMKMMPSGTLCRLSRLQRLILPLRVSVAVKSLNHLEEFRGRFADMDVLRQFLKSRNSRSQFISYNIRVGIYNWCRDTTYTKSIIIDNCKVTGEVVIGDDIVLLLSDTKELRVVGGDNNIAKCILRVREDNEQNPNGSPLESLEYLNLVELHKLRNIIEVGGGADLIHPPPATFSCLKMLVIGGCPEMKKVLSRCFLDNLRNLELLSVYFCSEMEEIIGEENEGEENNMGYHSTTTNHGPTLPKLRELHLWKLPELKSIWKSNMNCNSIRHIKIYGCTKLKKVPLFVPHVINSQLSPPPTLKNIYIDKLEIEWWDSLEWDHPQYKNILQPFCRIW